MLKKRYRLTSDFHFKITKKYGRKYNFRLFTFYICKPLHYEGPAKIGIITPVSFNKSSVKRNRAKRLLSEAVKSKIDSLPNDNWILIYPKEQLLETKYEEICNEFNKAISEISFNK